MAESTRSRAYEKIQEEQQKILSSYYDKGMTTTGKNMQKTIEEAAAKTNLSIDRVKLAFLERLGCEASILLLEPGNSCLHQYGTKNGLSFLDANEKVGIMFVEYLDSPKTISYRVCDVVKLFNKKYSEACGKKCHVPYSKGGFEVSGLPEGIAFKKPQTYLLNAYVQM